MDVMMEDIIDIETLDILEEEFDELKGIKKVYINKNQSYYLDYFVIDCYIFGKSLKDTETIYIKLIYDGVLKNVRTTNFRNFMLIEFLRKNKHMIGIWML